MEILRLLAGYLLLAAAYYVLVAYPGIALSRWLRRRRARSAAIAAYVR